MAMVYVAKNGGGGGGWYTFKRRVAQTAPLPVIAATGVAVTVVLVYDNC